jgi:hypothetical protein
MKKNPNGGFDGVAILLEVVWRCGIQGEGLKLSSAIRSVVNGEGSNDDDEQRPRSQTLQK